MKKIRKAHIVGLFVGLLAVLVIEIVLNHQKYLDRFNEGYGKAHQSELKA